VETIVPSSKNNDNISSEFHQQILVYLPRTFVPHNWQSWCTGWVVTFGTARRGRARYSPHV